jgi:Ca-activated chloride channel family protein
VLLKFLAEQNGVFEWVRSSEPMDFKLKIFLSKIGSRPVENLSLAAPAGTDLIYALDEAAFPGSAPAWVGEYTKPGRATFGVSGMRDGKPLAAQTTVSLPSQNTEFPYLPRAWAKARVDALLDKINRDGEDQASIDEIIRLSRKYKFVTPYTSFLAAPRSLLRPRLIRPGDPVLRIKTDAAILSVVAMFPFGLVKKLRYLEQEDVWQTRFFAPTDMKDGTYQVQLLLRDRNGQVYRESKSFVIASTGPVVRAKLDKTRYRGGDVIALKVSASETTRTITARLYGAMPARLKWNADMKSNTGSLTVPAALPAGRYMVTVTAEDFAHNIASQEVAIDVVP